MKKLIIILFFLSFSNLYASEIKLEKIADGLKKPWSLSFIDKENVVITERSGKLFTLNLLDKIISEIKHNLSVLESYQGGLLDVLYDKDQVYISYSENRGDWKTSTSVAIGKFNKKNIEFKNIFRAEPPIDSGFHYGAR